MIAATCDKCGQTPITIWGTVSYSPGGGRHGIETWHFCHGCVPELRAFVLTHVPAIPEDTHGAIFASHGWMIREDYLKQPRS
jgi:hypothetical protein